MTVLEARGSSASCRVRPERGGSAELEPVPSFPPLRGARALLERLIALGLVSCSGTAAPKAENHACFRALDCQAGLVCVEGRCTSDLTPIVPEFTAAAAPEPAAGGDAGSE